MIKKILKIIGVILLVVILVAIVMIVTLYRNPGLYLKLVSEKIIEDQAVDASYNYDFDDTSKIKTVPYFFFTPSESGNYTFSVENIESSNEVYMTMSVMNKFLDDYFVADNRDHDTDGLKNTISDTTALQASQTCFVLFTVDPVDEDLAQFSGSFRFTVTRDPVDEGPPQLTTEEPVTLETGAEGQACAAFIPPETGYYRFEHSIVSHDSSRGYSSISSVTSSNKIKVGLTSDICKLYKDKEYYVWVSANETDSKGSEIELACSPMKTEKAGGICSLDIAGDSVIEYVADKDCDLAVYTVSAGDPKLVIYEKAGFPLRTDDRSEASLSNNPEDSATVLRVKKGAGLHICVFDDIADCRVFITEYTGDGTSLTMDDLVPVPEDTETDVEANEKAVEDADEKTDEEAEEENPWCRKTRYGVHMEQTIRK